MKLTEEQRQDIITLYQIQPTRDNAERIAKEYNITSRYIYKLLKQNKEKELSNITDNSSEFSKRANEIIKLALDRIEQEIKSGEKITLSQLSTTLGILYDKSRLENNQSTENKSINININIE